MKIRSILAVALAVTMAVVASFSLASCEKDKLRSLSKMRSDEKKAIKALIAEKGLKTADYVPNQTSFDPSVYYLFDSGLYMRVINEGGEKPKENETHVFVRMKGYIFPTSEDGMPSEFDNITQGDQQPIEFIYVETYELGEKHFKLVPAPPGYNIDRMMCEGVAFPMSLLGDGARVSLIVPFGVGPDMMSRDGKTLFVEEVDYVFAK